MSAARQQEASPEVRLGGDAETSGPEARATQIRSSAAPRISLCAIVGDVPAKMLERFVTVFEPWVDEIVLVTARGGNPAPSVGYFDAALWGSRIFEKVVIGEYLNKPECADWPHVDDFAAARNMAWSMGTGDWLMWADTDDIISAEAGRALRGMIEEHGEKFDMLATPYVVPDTGINDNLRERVVRRGIARWVQPVHECLEPIEPGMKWRTATSWEARIVHDPGQRPSSRNGRNLRILESVPEAELTQSLRYHLFAEHLAAGNTAKGIVAAEAFLQMPGAGTNERFECMFSMSLVAEEPKDKVAWLQMCLQECPWRREPYVLLANIMQNAGDLERAEAYLRAAAAQPLPKKATWNLRRKMWGWQFVQEQGRLARAQGRYSHADAIELNHFIRHGGRITLLHATRGRPQVALEMRNLWLERAEDPDGIEHIFALDEDDEEGPCLAGFHHVVQGPETVATCGRGPVGAWNLAARVAHGQVLVQVSDDMVPPQGWDREILERLEEGMKMKRERERERIGGEGMKMKRERERERVGDVPMVLRVSDGHRGDGLVVLAIVTRAWVEQCPGRNLFHRGFFSMYSDNWLTQCAEKAGVMIEARDLVFEHRHPVFTGEEMHATTAVSNRLLHYATGAKVLEQLSLGATDVFTWEDVPGLSLDDSPARVHERVIAEIGRAGNAPRCVEVGVAKGRGLACMATLAEFFNGLAVGIDCFEGTPGENVEYPEGMEVECRRNLDRCGLLNVVVRRGWSVEEARALGAECVDYVFVDAAHDLESVRADIAAWWPRVRAGGYLAGHDYIYARGVKKAVDEVFPDAEKVGECWVVQKRRDAETQREN